MRFKSNSAVIVIGAGPAGLTAAYELVKEGIRPLVVEKSSQVGGIARTDQHRGYRYDIGGHRFFTKVPEVERLWNEVLGSDLIKVPRLSRIHYRGRFFNYPIEIWNAFSNLGLRVEGENLFPDNWIYVHPSGVRVGRIQNFGNWSSVMVPETGMSSLGLEYFCTKGDEVWEMADAELVELAALELSSLGLLEGEGIRVRDGFVIRQEKAYPVYDEGYRESVRLLQDYLSSIENLQTIGRNGLHRYNNQDHSMLTAILAVKKLFGEKHDLWEVNTERSYHENFVTDESANERVTLMEEIG